MNVYELENYLQALSGLDDLRRKFYHNAEVVEQIKQISTYLEHAVTGHSVYRDGDVVESEATARDWHMSVSQQAELERIAQGRL